MMQWQAKGAILKRERLYKRILLKEAAKLANLDYVLYSKIERGIVDPDLYD